MLLTALKMEGGLSQGSVTFLYSVFTYMDEF